MDRQQTLAIMAAVLEAGERAKVHYGSHVLSAHDFVERAAVILKQAESREELGEVGRSLYRYYMDCFTSGRSKKTAIVPAQEERLCDSFCYVAAGETVISTTGEALIRDPLKDYSGPTGMRWHCWKLPARAKNQTATGAKFAAEQPVIDPQNGGTCPGGIFCICRIGWGHRAWERPEPQKHQHRKSRSEPFMNFVVLDCGCSVMKGTRCQFHGLQRNF